jgi:diguanylate cyclase (GGDEF)-like protein
VTPVEVTAMKRKARPSTLQKCRTEIRTLRQEVLMFQSILEGMRKNLRYKDLLKLIARSVTQGMGFDRAGIFLVTPDGKHLDRAIGMDTKGRFEWALPQADMPALSLKKGFSVFSDIVHGHRHHFFSNDIREVIPDAKVERGVTCNANVPIKVGDGKIIGVLAVDNLFTHHRLTTSDIVSLQNFATQAGMAIQSFRLHEKIFNLTVVDPLTEVYNRRFFDSVLVTELRRSERYARPCGLLYIDIDRFKEVNDTGGHAAGDEVLKRLALAFRSAVRNIDVVARIGGDEFAIVLPETPREGIQLVANRLLEKVAGDVPPSGAPRVTLSLGVAVYPGPGKDAEAMKKLADKSLYIAKEAGRNRVGPFATAV